MKIAASLLIFLLTTSFVSADIKINEIYPAPSDSGEEWVELYNDSDQTIDLTSYRLHDKVNTTIALQNNSISSHGYAIGTSKNVLNNSGDDVILQDSAGSEIDTISYPTGLTNIDSYARCPDGGSWIKLSIQTKLASNDSACASPATATPIQNTNTPNLSPTNSIQTDYNNIVLSEALVYPETNTPEWVEIYNGNDFAATLTDWYLDDGEGIGSPPRKFSMTIAAKGLATVEIPSSSSIFNNDGDIVRLLNSAQTQKDTFSYSEGERGKTWGKINLTIGSICQQEPSRGANNTGCIQSEVLSNSQSLTDQKSETSVAVSISETPSAEEDDDLKIVYLDYISAVKTDEDKSAVKGATIKNVGNIAHPKNTFPLQAAASGTWFFSSLNLVFLIAKVGRSEAHKLYEIKKTI